MEFIDKKLSQYSEEHTTPENELLKALNRDTHVNVLAPRMLSGHLQGRLLSLFSNSLLKDLNPLLQCYNYGLHLKKQNLFLLS